MGDPHSTGSIFRNYSMDKLMVPYITDLRIPPSKFYIPVKETEMEKICDYLEHCPYRYIVIQSRNISVNNSIKWFNSVSYDPELRINKIIKKKGLIVLRLLKNVRDPECLLLLQFLIVNNETAPSNFFGEDVFPNNIKNIMIVGNGPQGLDDNSGQKIDNFDYVVRMNRFRIEGFEKMVGTKCDIALLGATKCLEYENNLIKIDEIQKYSKRMVFIDNISKKLSKLLNIKEYLEISYEIFKKFVTTFGTRSTGLFAIIYAVIKYMSMSVPVHIVGFSNHKESTTTSETYYYGTFDLGREFHIGFHSFDIQEKFLNWMLNNRMLLQI